MGDGFTDVSQTYELKSNETGEGKQAGSQSSESK